jgi:malonyl CoA-acyl carrier protein transacylase
MPYAFHSPHMDPLQSELLAALSKLAPQQARIPFFSTVSGRDESNRMLNAEYWWKNLREPVLFADAVTAAVRSGCRRVVELGPQPALLRMAADCGVGVGETVEVLPTLQRGVSSKRALMETLAHAWCQGLEPNWSAVYPGCCPHQSLPVHPWQRQTHWLESPAVRAYRTNPLDHPLLGRRVYGPGARWEVQIDLARLPELADHRIRGDSVMPAAAYVEQMLAVGRALFGNVPIVINHLELDRMLILDQPRSMTVVRDETSGRTTISSESDNDGDPWVTQAHARVLPSAGALQASAFPFSHDQASKPGTSVSVNELYRRLDEGGNRYGPYFRCVRSLRSDGQQAWAHLELFTPPCSTARFKSFLSCYGLIIDQNSICQSVSIELKSVETSASKPIVWFVMPIAMTKFWVPISTSMINPMRRLLFCWVVVVAQLNRLNRTACLPRPSLGNGRRSLLNRPPPDPPLGGSLVLRPMTGRNSLAKSPVIKRSCWRIPNLFVTAWSVGFAQTRPNRSKQHGPRFSR